MEGGPVANVVSIQCIAPEENGEKRITFGLTLDQWGGMAWRAFDVDQSICSFLYTHYKNVVGRVGTHIVSQTYRKHERTHISSPHEGVSPYVSIH